MSAAAPASTAEQPAPSAPRRLLRLLVRRHGALAALLLALAANWLLWASAVPFGEAPDEPSHLAVAEFVAAHGRLPVFGPDADEYVRLDQVGIPIEPHALAPPLPYLLDGALIRLLPLPPVAAARLGSLLAALAAVALTYAVVQVILREAWAVAATTAAGVAGPASAPTAVETSSHLPGISGPSSPGTRALALATAALVAAVPEVSFLAATVNSDVVALAAALGAACLWPRVRRARGALAFGLALGLVLLAKYTAYPVIPLALLAATWQLTRDRVLPSAAAPSRPERRARPASVGSALLNIDEPGGYGRMPSAALKGGPSPGLGPRPSGRRGEQPPPASFLNLHQGGGPAVAQPASGPSWRYVLARLGLVALGTTLVAAPWLARNWTLYGQPWPLGVSEAAFRALVPAVPIAGAPGSQHLFSAEYVRSWWTITFPSFWAGFGRVDLFAPAWCYTAILLALAVALAGLLRALRDPARRAALAAALRCPAGLLLVGWPLAVGLAVFAASLGRYYPAHGRYLIPALPPLALGLTLGWQAAGPHRRDPVRALAPWLLVAGLVALNLYCLLGVIVPRYYGPAAARVTVTVDEPRPGKLPAGLVPVRGWAVVSGRDAWQPGQVGGGPAWHAPAAAVWATLDGAPTALTGGAGAPRPDLARALGTPAVAGFAWQLDAGALPPGLHTLAVCAADPAASEPSCVPIPVRVGPE